MNDKVTSADQEPDYRHGYQSGIGGQAKEAYEGYLSSKTSYDWIVEQITEKRQYLAEFIRRKEQTVADRKVVYDALQEQVRGLSESTQKVKEVDHTVTQLDVEVITLKERRAKSHAKYSLLAGLIFFAAGIAFVMGDLIISHEIVAYALNI